MCSQSYQPLLRDLVTELKALAIQEKVLLCFLECFSFEIDLENYAPSESERLIILATRK